jgi:type I restriction-modification system DNA methylase subunit
MQEIFENYIQTLSSKFSHPETSEMGYRADFELLLTGIFTSIKGSHILHDPRASSGNKPDFIVLKDRIPLVYLEVKDITTSLDKVEKSEQMSRYFGYTNLVLSNYVEFRFYRNGERYGEPIKIAECDKKDRTIIPNPGQYEYLARTLFDFTQSQKEPIQSANHLAKIMGGRGQRIRDNIRYFLSVDTEKNKSLVLIYESLKRQLVHDLTHEAFADMYAQTLVYGLFTARFFDESPSTFTRHEALDLIPESNPLLRNFFHHIASSDFDKRLEYIVNELCEVFSHSDIPTLMAEYSQTSLWDDSIVGRDPIIHFYEDFLKEYDPELRRKMGAYYTPLPVVQFMVRSVDQLLKDEFGLAEGLADSSKNSDGVHRVQVLDPAVGTGTFISKVIGQIYKSFGKGQQGRWPAYVQNELLSRLHGFELMMTPYTIAHLKLSLAFRDTGFKYFNQKRLGIYLTNALEQGIDQQDMFSGLGFSKSIADEAKQASKVKNEKPIMIVIGNPPYSVSSTNNSRWITDLLEEYKKDLEGETNIQPLSDDYIKFIRLSEYFIEKNGSGIIAMITNNSFVDGSIHRQMRKHLLETFDDIYILDLHGSSKKKEKSPTGGRDENVFNIQQGVSINIFVRKLQHKNGFGKVHHSDLYGKKEEKFKLLNEKSINSVNWKIIEYSDPYYFFIPKDFSSKTEYENGFKIGDLFKTFSSGVSTFKDELVIDFSHAELNKKKSDLLQLSSIDLRAKYNLADSRDWKLENVIGDIPNSIITNFAYRPFDVRNIIYSKKTKGVISYPRYDVMQHMLNNNLSLQITSKNRQLSLGYFFISNCISDRHLLDTAGDSMSVFPLYLYNEFGEKKSNYNKEIVDQIENIVGKTTPEEILDYIYAVLYSPYYQLKYKEFLKIDFPRIPYPKDKNVFRKLVNFGTHLRQLHLLESESVNQYLTTYPIQGSDTVEKIEYKNGNVYINDSQYFGKVSEYAWNFWIGGYQPAQKWIKDRKGRELTDEDIKHYQKIIVALTETDKLMKEIDNTAIS